MEECGGVPSRPYRLTSMVSAVSGLRVTAVRHRHVLFPEEGERPTERDVHDGEKEPFSRFSSLFAPCVSSSARLRQGRADFQSFLRTVPNDICSKALPFHSEPAIDKNR